MTTGDGKRPLYIGLTLRGRIRPEDWRRVLQAVEVALVAVDEVRITAVSVSVGDDQVMSMRR